MKIKIPKFPKNSELLRFLNSIGISKKVLKSKIKNEVDWGGAKCPKYNIVGSEELTNLELAEIIAKSQNKN